MDQVTERILNAEWAMFDQVHNIGGRSGCQDDKDSFFLNRSSQLLAWSGEMRESYAADLSRAKLEGRNLLSEKYGYMMECTSPLEYERIRDRLPVRSGEKLELMGEICRVQVKWLRELSEAYPLLTGRGRSTDRDGDSLFATSFETYLWGELGTYSVRTLQLYRKHVQNLQETGGNLNREVLMHTVSGYGFSSLDEAEGHLAGK